MNRKYFLAALIGCLFGAAALALGDDVWVLTDAQLTTSSLKLVSLDQNSVNVLRGDGSQPAAISWDDIVELTHPLQGSVPPSGPFQLILAGGDRLGGEPAASAGDQLQWKSAELGQLAIPLDHVAAIARGAVPPERLAEKRADDQVQLANGDSAHGIVMQIGPDGVALQTANATPTLPWDSISAVLFSTDSQAKGAGTERMFRVGFANGDCISAGGVSLAGDQLKLTFADKSTAVVSLGGVSEIEQVNGPVSWLTSREPIENIYRPMFDEKFPARFDWTVDGEQPIVSKYPGFHHGIGCHSYSKITYALDGGYPFFRARFAVDTDSPLADVTVRVLLDDKVAWEEKNVKAGMIYPAIVVPLGDAKRLGLEVDYGDNYATQGRFVWLDPALVRRPPSTQP
jgi:NPCBM/NEW2 domain-containing protein